MFEATSTSTLERTHMAGGSEHHGGASESYAARVLTATGADVDVSPLASGSDTSSRDDGDGGGTGPTGLVLACLLSEVDLDQLAPYALVDAVADWTRVASWAQARACEAAAFLRERLSDTVGAHSVPQTTPDGRRWPEPGGSARAATAELALRLATTRPRAQDVVETGSMLNGLLAATGGALDRGDIDYPKAQIFARHLALVPWQIALEVEDLVLPRAPHLTPPQLEKEIIKALLEVDPSEAQLRHQDALKKRRVNRPRSLPDGMASIYAVLPAPHAMALDLALDAAARTARAHGDDRTTDQLRADALTTMGATALATGEIAPARPSAPGGEEARASNAPDEAGALGETAALDEAGAIGETAALDEAGTAGAAGAAGARDTADAAAASGEAAASHGTGTPDETGAPAAELGGRAGVAEPEPVVPPAFAPAEPGCPASGLPAAPASGPRFPLGSLGGAPVRINVTVSLDTLLGGDDPAALEGYGPITATAARALAAGGIWRRLVTDPLTGVVVDVGRTRYRPPASLAELVRARDRTCTRPGCNVRAEACDLDHTVPWGGTSEGTTSLSNLRCLCPADHALKSSGDFRVSVDPDGRTRWTTPSGHSYVRNPDATMTYEPAADPGRDPTTDPPWGTGPPPF